MRTLAIMNMKGGTGKTVTAINLAADLAAIYEARVLLIDADSQASLTEFVGLDADILRGKAIAGGVADLLRGLEAAPQETTLRDVSLLPADSSLIELDVSAARKGVANPASLRKWLTERREKWDYVVIDCPPAFSAAAIAALIAADEVVIPMKLDAFGIRGMANLTAQVKNMRRLNPGLMVAGILPTMFYASPQMFDAEKLLRSSGLPCFHHIRRSNMVDDSTFSQKPLIVASPKSAACRDYKIFCRDVVEGGAEYV